MYVCAGHINWDIQLYVDRLPNPDGESSISKRAESGGGSAANVAVGLAELGNEAHVLGSVGDDRWGNDAVSRLERADVDPHVHVADAPTTKKYILVDETGEVALLGTDGANEAFEADDLPIEILDSTSVLHLTSQSPETAATLSRRVPDDAIVSFDPGRRCAERDYDAVLGRVDLLFATASETRALDADVPAIVTKRGAEGATWDGPDETVEVPGIDIDAADTSGAGDAFAAGFLATWIEERDPARALEIANACGALAAATEGSDANLSWDRIERLTDR